MKICTNCILPDTFPCIKFNEQGVCNFCKEFLDKPQKLHEDKDKYKQKFLDLLNTIQSDSVSSRPYHLIMAYSGGKDSTYTMYLLKEKYKLRILAFSFDNGFVSERARSNIIEVTDRLGIDLIFLVDPLTHPKISSYLFLINIYLTSQ